MENIKIKFYRGIKKRYVLEGGTPREGADVAFKPQFLNALYFAKDEGCIYMNGKMYGFSGSLAENMVCYIPDNVGEVTYNSPSVDYGASITYLDEGGENKTIQLYRIYSGTPKSLKVGVDSNKDFRISLDLEESMMEDWAFGDNLLIAEGDKVGLYLGMKQDKENGLIRFGSFDNEGEFREFGSIEDTEFLRKSWLSSVGVVYSEETDSSVLRFVWGDDKSEKGLNTVVDIPIWNMKKYFLNGIELGENSVIEGKDINVGESVVDENDLDFSEDDDIATALKKIDIRLGNIENGSDKGVVLKEYTD